VKEHRNVVPAPVLSATAILAAVLLAVTLASLACGDPDAGATGVGDAYFPHAGNSGYDVASYELSLVVDPALDDIEGVVGILSQATQDLRSFSLDLMGLKVGGVTVNGTEAEYRREGQELIISCPEPLGEGETFSTEVRYSGTPEAMKDAESFAIGWQHVGDVIYTLDEPQGAATWFPVNDHPSDKATYLFRITVPKPYVAAANGVLVDTVAERADRTFVWEMKQPLASYLATVSVGEYTLEESAAGNGVPIRDYFAPELAKEAETAFARTGEMLAYYSELFGPYPFDAYGVLVPDVETGAAMENQTLSLFGSDLLKNRMSDPVAGPMYLSHELAHQWFGDSVTVGLWKDIWLNEGFATYASWLWLEHDQGPETLTTMVRQSLDMLGGDTEPPGDPGVDELFGESVYQRGALALHALRLTVGDEVFFRILREWVSRYQYKNASTEDFVALAQEVARGVPAADLAELFDAWLYDDKVPDLPGGG
jgi:aminopeptidase N